MKQIIVLPTWVLVRIMIPFLPKNHAWKNRRFSLKNWAEHSRDLNDAFSILFWVNGIYLFLIAFMIFYG